MAYKSQIGCEYCGEDDPIALTFHYRDPEKRELNLSSVNGNQKWDSILEELGKCEVVCANCFKKRAWRREECKGSKKHPFALNYLDGLKKAIGRSWRHIYLTLKKVI